MRDPLLDVEREELESHFQDVSNKYGAIITVCWSHEMHKVFTPQKDTSNQLTLDGMEMPRVTEFQESGE